MNPRACVMQSNEPARKRRTARSRVWPRNVRDVQRLLGTPQRAGEGNASCSIYMARLVEYEAPYMERLYAEVIVPDHQGSSASDTPDW